MRHGRCVGRPLLAGMLALALGACVHVKEPVVRVDDVRLGGLGLTGGTIYVDVMLKNPNVFGLKAEGVHYDIDVHTAQAGGTMGWQNFAQGDYTQAVAVGGHDSTRVQIPIHFRYAAMGGAVQQMLSAGSLDYRLSGAVALKAPISRSIPYRQSGTLTIGSP